MDDFKAENIKLATALDWNVPKIVKRSKGDGELLRRYARRKLQQKCKMTFRGLLRGMD